MQYQRKQAWPKQKFSLLYRVKSSMGYKYQMRSNRLATDIKGYEPVLYIQLCIGWKRKDSSNHDGVMKSCQSGEVQDVDTTGSAEKERQLFITSKPSIPDSSLGNLDRDSKDSVWLPDTSRCVWVTRRIVPLAACFLPKDRAEEWVGDLIEKETYLTHEGNSKWVINGIVSLRTFQLLLAAWRVSSNDLVSKRE